MSKWQDPAHVGPIAVRALAWLDEIAARGYAAAWEVRQIMYRVRWARRVVENLPTEEELVARVAPLLPAWTARWEDIKRERREARKERRMDQATDGRSLMAAIRSEAKALDDAPVLALRKRLALALAELDAAEVALEGYRREHYPKLCEMEWLAAPELDRLRGGFHNELRTARKLRRDTLAVLDNGPAIKRLRQEIQGLRSSDVRAGGLRLEQAFRREIGQLVETTAGIPARITDLEKALAGEGDVPGLLDRIQNQRGSIVGVDTLPRLPKAASRPAFATPSVAHR